MKEHKHVRECQERRNRIARETALAATTTTSAALTTAPTTLTMAAPRMTGAALTMSVPTTTGAALTTDVPTTTGTTLTTPVPTTATAAHTRNVLGLGPVATERLMHEDEHVGVTKNGAAALTTDSASTVSTAAPRSAA